VSEQAPAWWRTAVVYQVYVRSFADSNGDGIGDINGVRSKLTYLRDLGVDAIWFNPWYRSPLADGGYDVADYRTIQAEFGTLPEAESLIADAREMGIRTIVDIVPNHVSEEHPWFREALAAGPGSAARDRFWFHPGKGPGGDEMPTQWVSNFQGPTWTRTTGAKGEPGDWYLHLFAAQQPDLNWNHPEVREEHESVLRFWLDRGAAGIRIDSAALLVKDPSLPDVPEVVSPGRHPFEDRDEIHDIYRSWRRVTDQYPDERVLVGEVWVKDTNRFTDYLRPDELHTAFNFDLMSQPWEARALRTSIDTTLSAHAPVRAPSTWVLSNHDVTRPVTRLGRDDTSFAFANKRFGTPTDLELGLRRARAAALLVAALPGSLYIYQGDELGLPEVEDLPLELIQDPMHFRSEGIDPGRDGCRVPLPWSGDRPPFGFSPDGAASWLPQPDDWARLTAARQSEEPDSTLTLYRRILRLRRDTHELHVGELRWLDDVAPGVLAFSRGARFKCFVNLTRQPIALPTDMLAMISSSPLERHELAPDAAVWLLAR